MIEKKTALLLVPLFAICGALANFFLSSPLEGPTETPSNDEINVESRIVESVVSEVQLRNVRRMFRNSTDQSEIEDEIQNLVSLTEPAESSWTVLGFLIADREEKAFIRSSLGENLSVGVGDVFGTGNTVKEIDKKKLVYLSSDGVLETLALYKTFERDN